uniref:Uncharacterized protein n=1 Tax=Ixodes ricinus TaxID=34613 RepID=A0A147BDY6_IXORI
MSVFFADYFLLLYCIYTYLKRSCGASLMQPPKSVVYESLLVAARSWNALYKMGHIYFFLLSASFLLWSALSHLSALVSRRPLCVSRFLGFCVELRLVDVHPPPSPERPSRCKLRRSRAGNNGGRSSERWVDATALSQHCSPLGASKRECHDSTRAGCPFLRNVFAAMQGRCAHSCVQHSCWF